MAETPSSTRIVGQYDTFNDIDFCSDECPYLEFDQTEGWCLALNKELNFYDWFIAECVEPQP
jgi:hypothetical protein